MQDHCRGIRWLFSRSCESATPRAGARRFEPGEPSSGFTFVSEIKGGAVPKEYIPGVVKVTVCL